jgi:long-chain acyl-CoA synthetase
LFSQIEKIRSSSLGIEEFYLTSRHSEFTDVRPFNELLTDASDLIPPTLSGNSPAAIYYTSGTTGLPKAVIHTHGGLTKATELQIDQIAISPADTTVILFSLCYLIGFGSQILPRKRARSTTSPTSKSGVL